MAEPEVLLLESATSKGEPPPESGLDFWMAPAAPPVWVELGAGGGVAVSRTRPGDVLEGGVAGALGGGEGLLGEEEEEAVWSDCEEVDCVLDSDCVVCGSSLCELAVAVAVCVDTLGDSVTTTMRPHSCGSKFPSRATPIILVAGTRTVAHASFTRCTMATSPETHAALQLFTSGSRFAGKSSRVQPAMGAVYACWHDEGRFSMRGTNFESETGSVEVPRPVGMSVIMVVVRSAREGVRVRGRMLGGVGWF